MRWIFLMFLLTPGIAVPMNVGSSAVVYFFLVAAYLLPLVVPAFAWQVFDIHTALFLIPQSLVPEARVGFLANLWNCCPADCGILCCCCFFLAGRVPITGTCRCLINSLL